MKKVVVILATLALALPSVGSASEFGCQVFLCLGSKGKVSECDPILNKLYKSLAKGKPWPTCEEAEESGGQLVRGVEYYEPCAAGYDMLEYRGGEDGSYYPIAPSSQGGWGNDRVCQKLAGYQKDSEGYEYPVYEVYPAQRRAEPYWAEISVDGYTNRTYFSLQGH